MQKVKLREIACYSETRIELSNLTKDNYVGTDNLLQNKEGKVLSNYLLSKGRTTEYLENDILIANIRPYLRKIWFATNHGGSSADVLTIRTHAAEFDSKFIYYSLFQDSFFDYVMSGAKGSKMPRGDKNQVMNFEIPNIPLTTQQKIAGVLSALDDKIALNKRESARLEVLARAIYDYWFVQFDFPDSEGKPYKASGGQMVLSEELKREIPAGWEVKKLGEILNFQKGTEPGAKSYLDTREENTVPFYRVGDIDSQPSIFIKYNCDLKIAKIGDILVTFDGSVGKMGIDIEGAYSSGLQKIFDPSNKIGNATVWAIFLDSRIKATIEKYATGSVLKHASSSIPHLIIPYNPEIFTVFNVQVKPLFDKIQHNAIESRKLAALRDELLPLLMNGQVRVE